MHEVTTTEVEANALFSRPLFELQLYHAFERAARGLVDLEFAIRHWTMLLSFPTRYNATSGELASHEQRILGLVRDAWERSVASPDPAHLVEQTHRWLESMTAEVIARWRSLPAQATWYGCFRYTLEPKSDLAALHFYNCACPRSPFEDVEALRDDLRQCLLAIHCEAPEVQRVQCGSWVNNLARMQALFPRGYVDSLVVTDPNGRDGLGWWGQFVTKNGCLNESRAAELRATGRFHYSRLLGRCSLADALAHLRAD